MKNINIFVCIFSLASTLAIHASPGCFKYGIGADKTLYHVECYCNCAQHAQAGRAKCKECSHYNAPKVYTPQESKAKKQNRQSTKAKKQNRQSTKTKKQKRQRASRASSNS